MRWRNSSFLWISILAIAHSGCTNLDSFDVMGTVGDLLVDNPSPISINDGDDYTNSNTVRLNFDQEGASEMVIANSLTDCQTDASWQSFNSSVPNWALDSAQLNSTATVWAKFRDSQGNETDCLSDSIIHDSISPTASINYPDANSYANGTNQSSFTVRGSCEIDGNPVKGTISFSGGTSSEIVTQCASGTFEMNLDVSSLPDLNFKLTVSHADQAGNESSPDARTFVKDTQAPSVAITSPAPDTWISAANEMAITIYGTCSAEDAPQEVILSGAGELPSGGSNPVCDASGSWSATLDFTAFQGAVTVKADFADLAGNSAEQASVSLMKDNQGPTGTMLINSGEDFTNNSTVNLNFNATDDYSDSSSLQMYITNIAGCSSGGTWESIGASRTWSLSALNTTSTVYFQLRDLAGNKSACLSDSIIHDDTPPSATFGHTFPASPSYASDPFLFGDASDANGVESIEFFVNESSCSGSGVGSSEQVADFHTTGLQITVPTEFNDIYAMIKDAAGNKACIFLTTYQRAPAKSFAFMSGGSTANEFGPGKIGAREGAVTWSARGTAWLFGGYGKGEDGTTGYLNDLWRKDPGGWTLVAGSATVNAPAVYDDYDKEGTPGGRAYATGWVDQNGWLWLFGGLGKDINGTADDLSDVWAFDGSKWIWKGGSSTGGSGGMYPGQLNLFDDPYSPSAREGVVSWYQNEGGVEYAYIFGGLGYGTDFLSLPALGYLNDVWKLRLDDSQWALVFGSSQVDTATTSTVPGSRDTPVAWSQPGKLWLFGGYGKGSDGMGHLSDLWYWNTGSSQWQFVNGPLDRDNNGILTNPTTNFPGGRISALGWTDLDGNLWLFGGWGLPSTGTTTGYLNDVWMFDGSNWYYVTGTDATNQSSVYSQMGVASSGNSPAGRAYASGWRDQAGHFWIFGGSNGPTTTVFWNDVWKFIPPPPDSGTPSPPPPPSN